MGPVKRYKAPKLASPTVFDGKLDKAPWLDCPWSDDFVDIEGDKKPKPRLRTRMKMAWDDQFLMIAAELEEPHLWATLVERDSVIFYDNDFEVFLDPDGDTHLYGELEINALNTVWDLLLVKPYREGGPAINGWDIKGLRTGVFLDGTLNDPSDTDRGWSVEIGLPWPAIAEISRVPCPPRPGDVWKINFSRVQWVLDVVEGKYVKRAGLKEDNWVWSPQGVIDMHQPEMWGELEFLA